MELTTKRWTLIDRIIGSKKLRTIDLIATSWCFSVFQIMVGSVFVSRYHVHVPGPFKRIWKPYWSAEDKGYTHQRYFCVAITAKHPRNRENVLSHLTQIHYKKSVDRLNEVRDADFLLHWFFTDILATERAT